MVFAEGDIVGDYRVMGLLGSGGMGSVYRVKNVLTDREEAMKLLLPDLQSAPDLAERFGREIKVHASLDHPNIASLRTAVRVHNTLLMIVELVEGKSLDQRLRNDAIEARQAIHLTLQILSALAYAHERGVIHRDIKPANIMLTPRGVVKLTDFGIASMAAKDRITRTGMAIGSLHYMSPEQIMAGPVDRRSDLYSVGVTLFEMLTGVRPFAELSEYELMKAQVERIPPSVQTLKPAVPFPLAVLVARALAKKPQDRFQTADEFAAALQPFSQGTESIATHTWSAPRTFQIVEEAAFTPTPANPPSKSDSKTPGTGSLDPVRIERVRNQLSSYIGPMARILVERAARKASNLQQLYDLVGDEIADPDDRAAFLKMRPR